MRLGWRAVLAVAISTAAAAACYRPVLLECRSRCNGACPSPLTCVKGYCSFGRVCPGSDGADAAVDAGPADAANDGDASPDQDADRAEGADLTDGADGAETDAAPGWGCPGSVPTSGGSCAPESQLCTYGTRPPADCRDVATCAVGTWRVRASTCLPPASSGCPSDPPASAAACPAAMVSASCVYTNVECKCLGDPDVGGSYACYRPNPPAPCPAIAPNAGTRCDDLSLACDYPCSLLSFFALTAACIDGFWAWASQRTCTAP